jgi:hypothetical protein
VNCADFEILLADYVDKTLAADEVSAFEAHAASCALCRELARDVTGAVAFMERAENIDVPPELVNKLLFEVTNGASRSVIRPSLSRRLLGGGRLGGWFESVLQPRFAMGMAMTVLSLGMMLRFAGPIEGDPVKLWAATEDRVTRWWDRAVKYYHSLQIVFEIQTRYEEWSDQQEAAKAAAEEAPQTAPGKESK